jgi:hypothetical protein
MTSEIVHIVVVMVTHDYQFDWIEAFLGDE